MKLGTTELMIILAIVMLLFGPSQIPKLTRMFGRSVKSFRDGMNEDEEYRYEEETRREARREAAAVRDDESVRTS